MFSDGRPWWEPKAVMIPLLAPAYPAGVVLLVVVFDQGIGAAVAIQVSVAIALGAAWTFNDWRAHRGPWRRGT